MVRKNKLIVYVIIGVIVASSFAGMVSSAVASTRAGNTATALTAKQPATVAAWASSANIVLGLILLYLFYKMTPIDALNVSD